MNVLKKFQVNENGNDYVVGDIHGTFTRLESALNKIGFNPDVDRLFCVGDLVDRGPDSELATDWLFKPWFHSVRGNHEQLLIDAYDNGKGSDAERLHEINGGLWFSGLPDDHRAFVAEVFRGLPYMIEVETQGGSVGVIHADVVANSWDDTEIMIERDIHGVRKEVLWSRSRLSSAFNTRVYGVDVVFAGHTYVDSHKNINNVHYIETAGWNKAGFFTLVNISDFLRW